MRVFITSQVVLAGLMAFSLAAYGQQPPDRGGDRPPPADAPPPRGGPRADEGRTPPPGRGGPRPKAESPDQPNPDGAPRGFGAGFPRSPNFQPPSRAMGGAGFGGGFGGGGYGAPMPGMMPGPGMFGGEGPPDDPEMRELMKKDAELDRHAHEIAAQLREMRGEERTRLKTRLSEVINEPFEVRQKRRELSLKRMEEELKRLRDAIADRNKSRDSIVDNRVRELTGEQRDLDF